jgi:hypothetical protein
MQQQTPGRVPVPMTTFYPRCGELLETIHGTEEVRGTVTPIVTFLYPNGIARFDGKAWTFLLSPEAAA